MSEPSCDWLVQIPDLPDAKENRMSNLSAHLEYNGPQIAARQLVMSGPTLAKKKDDDNDKDENKPPTITGSVLVFRAANEEGVWEMIKGNPYAKLGVWNLDKTTVTPFKCAVRTPL